MKQGWEEIKMVDACEILTCGVASTPTYVDKQIGVPFLSAQNVRDGEVVLEKYSFISKEFHQKLISKNKPSKGDILYSRVGAKYGEAGVVEHSFEFSVYVSVTLIRPKRELLNNYFLKNYLNSPRIKDLAKKSISSSGVPNLNVNSVRDFLVPIPPLPEQQRIVAILDEAFAAIAKAKANAEQNLKNAKELFESYLQEVFENKGESWEAKTLGEVCEELFAGGDVPKGNSSKYETDEFRIPIFSNGEKNKGLYGFTNISRVTKPSITISARGTIGYSEIRHSPFYPAIRLIVVTPKNDIVSLHYLKYVISGIDFKHSGSSIPQLTVPMIKEYPISFPSLKQQQVIVQKLDALSLETKKLEAIYQQKINDLEELKKSVLQKAFSGEFKTEKVLV